MSTKTTTANTHKGITCISLSFTDALSSSSFPGLMADETGNYIYSFYMTGGALLMAFLIPMVLIVINKKQSRVHPQNVTEVVTESIAFKS